MARAISAHGRHRGSFIGQRPISPRAERTETSHHHRGTERLGNGIPVLLNDRDCPIEQRPVCGIGGAGDKIDQLAPANIPVVRGRDRLGKHRFQAVIETQPS